MKTKEFAKEKAKKSSRFCVSIFNLRGKSALFEKSAER